MAMIAPQMSLPKEMKKIGSEDSKTKFSGGTICATGGESLSGNKSTRRPSNIAMGRPTRIFVRVVQRLSSEL